MSLLAERRLVETRRRRRERRRLRRALAAQDHLSARLAELFRIDAVLEEAGHVVERGWMQHAWYRYVEASGASVTVTVCSPRVARRMSENGVTAACLVGAIVHAGGGPTEARGQLVQRTLDLAWHASFRGADEPVRLSPSSFERLGRAIDLVRWNDRPERTADDVTALLANARGVTQVEIDRTRAQQRELAPLLDA
jgi:hypothetical protein